MIPIIKVNVGFKDGSTGDISLTELIQNILDRLEKLEKKQKQKKDDNT